MQAESTLSTALPALPSGATLKPDGAAWLLHYQLTSFSASERLPSLIDVTVPLAARSYAAALQITEVLLRGCKLPETQEQPDAQPLEQEPPDSLFLSSVH